MCRLRDFARSYIFKMWHLIDGLVQERHTSIANALELRLSCTNPSLCDIELALGLQTCCQLIGCTEHQHVQGPFSVFNSLAPGSFQWNLRKIIFKLILVTDGCDISSEIALRWTSRYLNDDKSRLVLVMAWCCQATSHYLSHVDLDPCRHMASLGHNKLKCILQSLEPLRNDVTKFIYFKIGRYVWQLLLLRDFARS